jgi:hypothetical protein
MPLPPPPAPLLLLLLLLRHAEPTMCEQQLVRLCYQSVAKPLTAAAAHCCCCCCCRLNMVSMEEQLVPLNKFIENWPASAKVRDAVQDNSTSTSACAASR